LANRKNRRILKVASVHRETAKVPDYLHLSPEVAPPAIEHRPFRAVIVIEEKVTDEWRQLVSDWLVRSDCLYAMAWGYESTKWDDSVDHANLAAFDYGDIPEDRFVMTTWHEKETLSEVFWFAKHCAYHSKIDLESTLIVHIAATQRKDEMLKLYCRANHGERE
jgi:hypothetical protein